MCFWVIGCPKREATRVPSEHRPKRWAYSKTSPEIRLGEGGRINHTDHGSVDSRDLATLFVVIWPGAGAYLLIVESHLFRQKVSLRNETLYGGFHTRNSAT